MNLIQIQLYSSQTRENTLDLDLNRVDESYQILPPLVTSLTKIDSESS